MSSVGSPADSNTITMDTMPACGMPAAPVLAAVTIKLKGRNDDGYVKQAQPINSVLRVDYSCLWIHKLKVDILC